MTEVRDGWIHGELPGPDGFIEVVISPRNDQSWVRLAKDPPNLCLHTTEGGPSLGDAYKRWDYPPNFACGDDKIVQLFPLGFASKAVDTKDAYLLQVEMAWTVGGKPANKVYLPDRSTLYPVVALTAFLHEKGLITNGLRRPNLDWPVALDRGPQASESYYRRHDGTWPQAGVYGHVEIPDDEHWDPGSFDYPRFFAVVRDVLEGDGMRLEEFYAGLDKAKDRAKEMPDTDIGPPPDSMKDSDRKEGWSLVRFIVNQARA